MDVVDELLAIERIKKLKARYWYVMDTKDREGMRELFTEDALFDLRADHAYLNGIDAGALAPMEEVAGSDDGVLVGGRNIADSISGFVADWVTVHQGHAPIIDITGPDTATGIWPFFDFIDNGSSVLQGYGHYVDEYRRVDGTWLMHRVQVTRLRMEGAHPLGDRD
jgi:hypothetical protein